MSTHPERDPAIDPLIRAAIRPNDPGDLNGCVDAERLAAWAEGGLTETETAAIDAHLATCARCQALMAAFAQEPAAASISSVPTATPSAPAVLPFRPRPVMKWIVPLAAGVAAASLLVWTAWPRPNATVTPEQTVADATVPATTPPTARRVEESAAIGAQDRATVPSDLKKEAAPAASPRQSAAKLAQEQAIAPKPSPAPAPAAPAITVPPTPIPMASGVPQVTIAAPPAAAPTFRAPAAGTGEVVMLRSDADPVRDAAPPTPVRVVAEFAPPTTAGPNAGSAFGAGGGGRGGGRGGGGGGGSRASGAAGAGGMATATVPAPRVLWRVLATGEVRKSTDNGQTWSTVVMKPPVLILNGAAPSPTVCWLVGRAGIVMLSTDGVRFVRVFFPDVSDLRSITAVDAREATVTTTDGRVFVTIDGGENWEIKK